VDTFAARLLDQSIHAQEDMDCNSKHQGQYYSFLYHMVYKSLVQLPYLLFLVDKAREQVQDPDIDALVGKLCSMLNRYSVRSNLINN
jgi:hypothetical protein